MLTRRLNLQLPQGQSLFLWGARKTGKSTFLADKYPNSMYVDFLHNATFLEYSKNPGLLRERIEAAGLNSIKSPVIIDEVQKVPEILDEIHWMIEHFKGIAFIMAGRNLLMNRMRVDEMMRDGL